MADYYFKTVGQAWQALVNQFTAFGQLTYNATGFSATWVPSGAANGGRFVVDGTVSVGEAYANGSYWAQDAKTGAGMPLAAIGRQAGMEVMPEVEPVTGPDPLTPLQLKDALAGARGGMFIDVTGCNVDYAYEMNTQLAGAGTPIIWRTVSILTTAVDQMIDWTLVLDTTQQPTGAPITEPVSPGYSSGQAPTVNNLIQTAPNLDTDVTVNPGGGVYSITSRQFTNE